MPYHELTPGPSEFAQIEHSVSDELLQDDAVLTLFSHALAERGFTSDRPGLMVRPFYDPILPAQLGSLGLRRLETVPMSLQIEIPSIRLWNADPYPSADFVYVKLGVTTDDESQSFVYDSTGQLRERLDVISGDTLEKCRALAVPSWKAAHHTMLSASRQNAAIRLDHVQGIWTDAPPEEYMEFDLQ